MQLSRQNSLRFSPPAVLGAALFVAALGALVLLVLSSRNGQRTLATSPNTSATRPVEILVSCDTSGWIVPCGCTSNQSGGLLKRGSFVRQQRAKHDVVLLDAGGAPSGTSPYDVAKFEAILDGELLMGLAAHNLGAPELLLGASRIRELTTQKKVPFISANTLDNDGRPIADPYRLISAGGLRLAVIGVVAPRFATAECRITEPQAGILAARQALSGKFDALIVLAYLPDDELRQLASALPEADLIIGGPTGQSIAPVHVGPVLLAAATNKGKFLVSLRPSEVRPRPKWRGNVVEMTAPLGDDEDQQKNLALFRATLDDRDFTAEESGLRGDVAVAVPSDVLVSGNAACRDCHATEFASWQASAHAQAWQAIAKQRAHVDSYCQPCHTTGYGWPGGFVSLRRSQAAVNVGCESCHGPAHAHAKDPAQRTPLAARESCLVCHDRDNSPEFEFAKYWPAIIHGIRKE